jgi:hypothetical protein
VGLKLNGTHQLLVYAVDVNPLGDNRDTIKNTEFLIVHSKVVGLEVNAEKTKYMLLSVHQNAGQNHDIKIANRWFESVAQFRHLGSTAFLMPTESAMVNGNWRRNNESDLTLFKLYMQP